MWWSVRDGNAGADANADADANAVDQPVDCEGWSAWGDCQQVVVEEKNEKLFSN